MTAPRIQRQSTFVVCDFDGARKVGKLNPDAPFGLPDVFVGEFPTEAEAVAEAERCFRENMSSELRYRAWRDAAKVGRSM